LSLYSNQLKNSSNHTYMGNSFSAFHCILNVILVFFYIYSIRFNFFPNYLFTGRIIVGFGLIYLFDLVLVRRKLINIKIDSLTLGVISLFFLYFLWGLFRTAAFNFEDTTFATSTLLIFIQIFAGAMFVSYIIFKQDKDFDYLILVIQMAIVLQGFFIILSFLSIDFKILTMKYIEATGNIDAMNLYRVRGLTHSSGAGLSILQSIGLLFSTYLLVRNKKSIFIFYLLISIVILFFSILLTGISGLLIIPIILLFFLLYILQRAVKGKFNQKILALIILVPIIVFLGFQVFKVLYQLTGGVTLPWGTDALNKIMVRINTEFKGIGKNTINLSTVNLLLEKHWFFPKNEMVFLLGDPRTYFVNRIPSDIGVVRRIFGLGIIGATLAYLSYISMFALMIYRVRKLLSKDLIFMLMLWLLVLEFKEPFIFDFRFISVYSLMFFFLYYTKKIRHRG